LTNVLLQGRTMELLGRVRSKDTLLRGSKDSEARVRREWMRPQHGIRKTLFGKRSRREEMSSSSRCGDSPSSRVIREDISRHFDTRRSIESAICDHRRKTRYCCKREEDTRLIRGRESKFWLFSTGVAVDEGRGHILFVR
jgi:hypothetical protein